MTRGQPEPDWDPRSDEVQANQVAAYDRMRESCPVAYSDFLGWSLFRHADVRRVLLDHETFSSVVSSRRVIPSGMDPPEHTPYRRIVELYFTPERMEAFEGPCREIAAGLVDSLLAGREGEVTSQLATPFAVQVQCAFLGWPAHMHEPLRAWILKNHGATLAQDRAALATIASEFEAYVDELLMARRAAGKQASDDITTELLEQKVEGKPLTSDEIVSILRNWTAGEVGTISASISILLHFLAEHPEIQEQLRNDFSLLPRAIDEILRLHGPLVANRRLTTRPVTIGGREIPAGERISINWIAANRDPEVFAEPDRFRLDRNPDDNLLYGAGIHVCPGASLARMELRLVMEELLARSRPWRLAEGIGPVRASYPSSGFAKLVIRMEEPNMGLATS